MRDEFCIDKKVELVVDVKEEGDKEFSGGRTYAFGDFELDAIIKEVGEDRYIALCHHKKNFVPKKKKAT